MIDKSGWKSFCFEDIVINVKDKAKPNVCDEIPYIGLEHLQSESFEIPLYGASNDVTGEKILMQEGDVLFGKRRAYQRKVGIAPFDGIFSAHGMVLRPKTDVILKELLPFFIRSNAFMNRAINLSVGSLSPTLNWTDIKNEKFILPPIEEQKCMAELLWAADEVVERWKYTSCNAKELFRATIDESYPIDVNGAIKQEDKEYNIVLLDKIATVFSGSTPSRKNASFWEAGNISWIKTTEINYNDIYDTEEKVTNYALDKTAIKIIPSGSVLLAMYGQGPTRGRVALNMIEATSNQACAAIVLNESVIPKFLYYYLVGEYQHMRDLAHGAAQPNLNIGIIKKFQIPLVSTDKQQKIVNILSTIERTMMLIEQHIEESKKLLATLINVYLGGAN